MFQLAYCLSPLSFPLFCPPLVDNNSSESGRTSPVAGVPPPRRQSRPPVPRAQRPSVRIQDDAVIASSGRDSDGITPANADRKGSLGHANARAHSSSEGTLITLEGLQLAEGGGTARGGDYSAGGGGSLPNLSEGARGKTSAVTRIHKVPFLTFLLYGSLSLSRVVIEHLLLRSQSVKQIVERPWH